MSTAVALPDRVTDRSTRIAACELALVCHAVLDPEGVAAYRGLILSPEAAAVLDAIIEQPSVARVALVSTVRTTVRARHAWGDLSTDVCRAAVALAREAETVRAVELAAIGQLHIVVDLLRDARANPSPLLRVVA